MPCSYSSVARACLLLGNNRLRHYALARQKGDPDHPPDIQPVPIEGSAIAPPPEKLRHLHFNDVLRPLKSFCRPCQESPRIPVHVWIREIHPMLTLTNKSNCRSELVQDQIAARADGRCSTSCGLFRLSTVRLTSVPSGKPPRARKDPGKMVGNGVSRRQNNPRRASK